MPLEGSKEADVRGIVSLEIFVSHIVLNITSGTLSSQMLQFWDNRKAGNLSLKLKCSSLQEIFLAPIFLPINHNLSGLHTIP